MFARGLAWLLTRRRWFSRAEWLVRWLRLPKSEETAVKPGLVMAQIDGLSRQQLEIAIEEGRMPFLKKLIEKERFHLHTFYSGIPSATPAVQGELFYGRKCATPAFSYRDHELGKMVRMWYPEPASKVERRLSEADGGKTRHQALLEGGSAYCDNYSGGAEEAHFCASTIGWGGLLEAASPLKLGAVLLAHGKSLLVTAWLMAVEFGLAVVDCCRGLIAGRDLKRELLLVPGRVTVSILMRELIAIGVSMDVARGLPIVHFNLLGYDEQAHRRGPSSAFAHWSLKGIDQTIKRIWKAARRSARRDYDVWVYSDHGQEETICYERACGQTIDRAVNDVLSRYVDGEAVVSDPADSIHNWRAQWLGNGWISRVMAGNFSGQPQSTNSIASVSPMGPLVHVYPRTDFESHEREKIARALVDDASVPIVLVTAGNGQARAFTRDGCVLLPSMASELFGADHPFLDEVSRDLVELCHHPDAGQFVLSGWRRDSTPMSFPRERGAHAGPGPEETRAFALLPSDAPLPETNREYIRGLDLRHAALSHLGRLPSAGEQIAIKSDRSLRTEERFFEPCYDKTKLRVMTYNVHSCVGLDGKLSPERVARIIEQNDVDVVALQELEVGRVRTGHRDQAQEIARDLEMHCHFHPAWQLEEEQRGNAILSRIPMRLVHCAALPRASGRMHYQPRGALWVELTVGGRQVQLINTHLDIVRSQQMSGVKALLGTDWLEDSRCVDPAILCGDFNFGPRSRCYKVICERLVDAQCSSSIDRPQLTWLTHLPTRRIDHVFTTRDLKVRAVDVPRTSLTSVASDHLPLIVDFQLLSSRTGATVEQSLQQPLSVAN